MQSHHYLEDIVTIGYIWLIFYVPYSWAKEMEDYQIQTRTGKFISAVTIALFSAGAAVVSVAIANMQWGILAFFEQLICSPLK